MKNQEIKQQMFAEVQKKYSHLSNYCTIECIGLDDDEVYYHPRFVLSEDVFISSQGDVGNNYIYAMRFNYKVDGMVESVEIGDFLLDSIVVGWHTNKDKVLLGISSLCKLRNHINNLNNYANDYIIQMLVGNSLGELTTAFINEFKTTKSLIDFIDSKK